MDKLNRELIVNVTLVSAVMTLLLAWIGTAASANNSSDTSIADEGALVFIIYTLILYIYHGLLSIVNYLIGRWIERLALRLAVFHIAGLLLLAAVWYLIRDTGLFAAYASIIAFSIVAVVSHGKKANS